MATAAAPRKSVSIYDYPEHLNPFSEEDDHSKTRFWTLGKSRHSRSNSINFSGIKDLKNSWAFRSFMKKGKRSQEAQDKKTNGAANADASPIVYRKAMQYSSGTAARITLASPEKPDRYVYGGSITPLPRSRFQERLRSPSQYEVDSIGEGTPRLARSEIMGSRLSVESTNPFDEGPVAPARRRKKKRAPPPPHAAEVSVISVESEANTTLDETHTPALADDDEHIPINIELKIVEDEDVKKADESELAKDDQVLNIGLNETTTLEITEEISIEKTDGAIADKVTTDEINNEVEIRKKETDGTNNETNKTDSEEDVLNNVSFDKVDIVKYRRNSSVNEDDFRPRRTDLDDYHEATTKRSKSVNYAMNLKTYPIDIHIDEPDKDANGNDHPRKVVCKLYNETRKQSLDNSISSTEKEFIEIDKATRELEREINKLNTALLEDDNDLVVGKRLSVSDIRRKFDNNNVCTTPNPIPKPRRSNNDSNSNSPVNGNYL